MAVATLTRGGRSNIIFTSNEDRAASIVINPHFCRSPPEAIKNRCFSQASDVWSWGVTLWEIWSGGAEPWSGLTSDAVLAELKAARRLPWPRFSCPRRLYQLLLAAWRFKPTRRPSFEYLVERLDKVYVIFDSGAPVIYVRHELVPCECHYHTKFGNS